MGGTSARAGHTLAKVLGIDLKEHHEGLIDEPARRDSVSTEGYGDTFIEEHPTILEWIGNLSPRREDTLDYVKSLFPFSNWISHYNLHWLAGDVVAGVTIGAIVVPQGMAYALLANLEPQYGLYSAFIGPALYWLFATSKDITIGPVAVMSTLVGNVVRVVKVTQPDIPAHVVASALSLVAGAIITSIGLLRCGWIVDLISLTSLSAFMTGSAITIGAGQLPSLLGLHDVNNREAPYLVLMNTWKHLHEATLDAVMGTSALCLLYGIRYLLVLSAKRQQKHQRLLFFLNTLRSVFVILLYTIISWLVNSSRTGDPAFTILGDIPRGFQAIGVPVVTTSLVRSFARFLPATVIVLLVEHIAISKSFGRINNYTIDPSQEMVAIGLTNLLGPFVGAYPATGSFSRTAIKSKAGVRTPASGVVTAGVVLLATYTLTPVFFYIPGASLAAVIIHAVADLITPPDAVYRFWRVSPVEVFIFAAGVLVSVFSSIEDGIYATVCASAIVLAVRVLKARGAFLGRVRVHSVLGEHIIGEDHTHVVGSYGTFTRQPARSIAARNIFLPISRDDGTNPIIDVQSPYPGIFIYRFTEGFNYPNASHTLEHFLSYILAHTRRTTPASYARPGDRPWNEPGPTHKRAATALDFEADARPTLKAVVLDFSAVNHVDVTSVQRLIDVRNQLDAYAAPEAVDWHFACVGNRWARRALAAAGFGLRSEGRGNGAGGKPWRSIFSVAEIGGGGHSGEGVERGDGEKEWSEGGRKVLADEESCVGTVGDKVGGGAGAKAGSPERTVPGNTERDSNRRRGAVVHGLNRPLFHVDLTNALQSAIANVEARYEAEHSTSMAGTGH